MKKGEAKKLNNKIHVIPPERSKQFIENFNKNKPTKEFIESCKKAGELFGEENDKFTEQNVADVSSDDLISREGAIDAIEYWHGIDVSEAINRLPSSDRPKGEWVGVEDDYGGIYWECSNCEDAFFLEVGTPKDNNYNFCPNCGADMRGEK